MLDYHQHWLRLFLILVSSLVPMIQSSDGFITSYLQVRGSIPVLWEQIVDLTYKPKLNIINTDETPKVVERHFHDLVQRYGPVLAVDLAGRQGNEGPLSFAYEDAVQSLKHIRYVSFDFHRICGLIHFECLQLLYERVAENLKRQGGADIF